MDWLVEGWILIVLTFSLSDWILYSVFFSFFEIYAYIFSISDPMISLKISCLILCVHYVLLLSICSLIWLVIPFGFHTGMVPFHFGHSFLVIPFVFIQGWCHIHFYLFFISSALPFVFQGWCRFHFIHLSLSHWKLL